MCRLWEFRTYGHLSFGYVDQFLDFLSSLYAVIIVIAALVGLVAVVLSSFLDLSLSLFLFSSLDMLLISVIHWVMILPKKLDHELLLSSS
jgi:hypothetical protein